MNEKTEFKEASITNAFIRDQFFYEDLKQQFDRGDIYTNILLQIQISRLLNEACVLAKYYLNK